MRLFNDMDFTLSTYRRLLESLLIAGYQFQTFEDYCTHPGKRVIILRHDVDRKPSHAVAMSEIESDLGIRGSYHFRRAPSSGVPDMIRKIAEAGHEIAYHYEDLAMAGRTSRRHGRNIDDGMAARAIESFVAGLEYFRQYYPIRVISMHGSPAERIDNRLLWKYYNYRDYGIICEPYFDIDHSSILYLTDTGRRWDGDKFNLRDKALGGSSLMSANGYTDWMSVPSEGSLMRSTPEADVIRSLNKFHFTSEIISKALSGSFPEKAVINTHPERWNKRRIPWITEACKQLFKNFIKMLIVRFRHN